MPHGLLQGRADVLNVIGQAAENVALRHGVEIGEGQFHELFVRVLAHLVKRFLRGLGEEKVGARRKKQIQRINQRQKSRKREYLSGLKLGVAFHRDLQLVKGVRENLGANQGKYRRQHCGYNAGKQNGLLAPQIGQKATDGSSGVFRFPGVFFRRLFRFRLPRLFLLPAQPRHLFRRHFRALFHQRPPLFRRHAANALHGLLNLFRRHSAGAGEESVKLFRRHARQLFLKFPALFRRQRHAAVVQ